MLCRDPLQDDVVKQQTDMRARLNMLKPVNKINEEQKNQSSCFNGNHFNKYFYLRKKTNGIQKLFHDIILLEFGLPQKERVSKLLIHIYFINNSIIEEHYLYAYQSCRCLAYALKYVGIYGHILCLHAYQRTENADYSWEEFFMVAFLIA